MTSYFKRYISFLLVLVMCISMLPVSALAEDGGVDEADVYLDEPSPSPTATPTPTPTPAPTYSIRITAQPQSVGIIEGGSLELSVGAEYVITDWQGGETVQNDNLTYLWEYINPDTQEWEEADCFSTADDSNVFHIDNVETALNGYEFKCVITAPNVASVETDEAAVTVTAKENAVSVLDAYDITNTSACFDIDVTITQETAENYPSVYLYYGTSDSINIYDYNSFIGSNYIGQYSTACVNSKKTVQVSTLVPNLTYYYCAIAYYNGDNGRVVAAQSETKSFTTPNEYLELTLDNSVPLTESDTKYVIGFTAPESNLYQLKIGTDPFDGSLYYKNGDRLYADDYGLVQLNEGDAVYCIITNDSSSQTITVCAANGTAIESGDSINTDEVYSYSLPSDEYPDGAVVELRLVNSSGDTEGYFYYWKNDSYDSRNYASGKVNCYLVQGETLHFISSYNSEMKVDIAVSEPMDENSISISEIYNISENSASFDFNVALTADMCDKSINIDLLYCSNPDMEDSTNLYIYYGGPVIGKVSKDFSNFYPGRTYYCQAQISYYENWEQVILAQSEIKEFTTAGEKSGVLVYKTEDENISIIGCDDNAAGTVTVPDTIGGLPVTKIADKAFYNCNEISEIVLPDSITKIGEYAFYSCDNLTNVKIGGSVASIGYQAFSYCASLTSIEIPASVTNIDSYAFNYCNNLNEIIFGHSAESELIIGYDAFRVYMSDDSKLATTVRVVNTESNNTAISEYDWEDSNRDESYEQIISAEYITVTSQPVSYIVSEGGTATLSVAADYTGNEEISYLWKSYNIYTKQWEDANDFATSYTESTFTVSDVTMYMNDYRFMCVISAPDSKTVRTNVVTISVESVGEETKTYGYLLYKVIDGGIKIIDCNVAASGYMWIPSTIDGYPIREIEDYAFEGCSGITGIDISYSINAIGNYSFSGCTALAEIYYSGSIAQWNAITIGTGNECLTNAAVQFTADSIYVSEAKNVTNKNAYFDVEFAVTQKTINASAAVAPYKPLIYAFYGTSENIDLSVRGTYISYNGNSIPDNSTSMTFSAFPLVPDMEYYVKFAIGYPGANNQPVIVAESDVKYFKTSSGNNGFTELETGVEQSIDAMGMNAYMFTAPEHNMYQFTNTASSGNLILINSNGTYNNIYISNLYRLSELEKGQTVYLYTSGSGNSTEPYGSVLVDYASGTAVSDSANVETGKVYSYTLPAGSEKKLVEIKLVDSDENPVTENCSMLYYPGATGHYATNSKVSCELSGGESVLFIPYVYDENTSGLSVKITVSDIKWDIGNVNMDNEINITDCYIIRRYAAGLSELSETQKSLADVNGDGKINVIDVNYVRRYVVQMISSFPAN